MSEEKLDYLSIKELSELIRTRKVSPVEVTRAALRRIEETEPRINAYITVTGDLALKQAEEAEKEITGGYYRGPLHGVPLSLKDLYYTEGVRTTAGSNVLEDFVPTEDAAVVQRLCAAGMVLVGKANLHEFAHGGTNENQHFGPCRNPWDTSRIPGGSSGGSGASLAAGSCYGSLGSDTGGSIRIPAACCGIVGLKPTYGRTSRRGVVPLAWSLDHVGPMTRRVEDAAIMLTAISGYDPLDPGSADVPVPNFSEGLAGDLRGMRVGVPREHFFDIVDPEVEAAVRAAIEELAKAGARVQEVSIPHIEQALPASTAIMFAEASAYHQDRLAERPEDYGAETRERLETGLFIPAVDYIKAQRSRSLIIEGFNEAFQNVDVIAAPTMPMPAPIIGQPTVKIGEKEMPTKAVLSRLTRPADVTGMPAISIPCGFTSAGLPISLQLLGRAFEEATILRAARAYEAATEWHTKHPAI